MRFRLFLATVAFFTSASASTSILEEHESAARLRDPFKRPAADIVEAKPRTELETLEVAGMTLVGVMTGPDRLRAMLKDEKGKTHLVSENTKVGIRNGYVKKITREGILIIERIVNILGQEEDVPVTISLGTEGVQE